MTAVIFEIFRYDPEKDQESYYKKYAVDINKKTTVAQVLRKIKDKADGSLTFRKGCGCAICGICAMRINGKAKLSCRTKVSDIVGDLEEALQNREAVRIEPLTTEHVIKDLVIDEKHFWEQLNRSMPWLNTEAEGKELNEMTQKQVEEVGNAHDCIHCHACTTGCDAAAVDPGFLGPEALVKVYRFVKDSRDANTYGRLRLATEGNLWNCVRAFTCIDECPKDIRPADKISELHEMAVENGLGGRGARHAEHFVHSLRKTGKLDEKMMPIKTLRAGVLGFVPDTIKMVSKGKLPSLYLKKIEDHKELWYLIELAKDRKEAKQEEQEQIGGGE